MHCNRVYLRKLNLRNIGGLISTYVGRLLQISQLTEHTYVRGKRGDQIGRLFTLKFFKITKLSRILATFSTVKVCMYVYSNLGKNGLGYIWGDF
jgi:hypothetical protein